MIAQKFISLIVLILILHGWPTKAQSILSGRLFEESTHHPVPDANILIKNTAIGTTSGINGAFTLRVPDSISVTLVIMSLDHVSKEVKVDSENIENLQLVLLHRKGDLRRSSVSKQPDFVSNATEKNNDALKLANSAAYDALGVVANLNGVQANSSGLALTSINTRGFADMQNWRFLYLVDGLDVRPPGLDFALGQNHLPSDLDISKLDLVRGPGGSMLGMGALNGTLAITTKDPFEHKGLSVYTKSGATVQQAAGNHPLFDIGFRYADASADNKLAFKINFNYFSATDWVANDESHLIKAPPRSQNIERLQELPRDHYAFNATNVYGDDSFGQVAIDTLGGMRWIARTGIKEEDIVDPKIENFKLTGGLYYQLTDSTTFVYNFQYFNSEAMLRHHSTFPLRDFKLFNHSLKLKGSHWEVSAGYSQQDANKSYAMFNTGRNLMSDVKSFDAWKEDYGRAFRGEVDGVVGQDYNSARQYADRDQVQVDDEEFKALINNSLNRPMRPWTGSGVVDNTQSFQASSRYSFKQIADKIRLEVGGTYRNQRLDSEGVLFNDGPQGFDRPISVNQLAIYLEAGKRFIADRLSIQGSLRYDQYQKLKGQLSPGFSAEYALDSRGLHTVRASLQSRVRNPSPQEGYMNLFAGPFIILGGTAENIENYTYRQGSEVEFSGEEILQGLVTEASSYAYRWGGWQDPTLLVPFKVSFLKQEGNTTFELGYRGFFWENLMVDIHFFQGTFNDFITRSTSYSFEASRFYQIYTNLDQDLTSYGVGLEIEGQIGNGYQIGAGYSFTDHNDLDLDPAYWFGFNTPQNRITASVANHNVAGSPFGFYLNFRYWDSYRWQSPTGLGTMPSTRVVDLALTYRIKPWQSQIKLGANNLLREEYQTVYTAPRVGSIYYISWTYDKLFGQ